jgi:hypothetical protein
MSQLLQVAFAGVKSIQRGTSSVACGGTVAVTVSAIVPAKSVLMLNGGGESVQSGWGALAAPGVGGVISNSTTLTLRGGVVSNGTNAANAVIDWQLVEYY